MSKRAPGSNLNSDNWDQETPTEEQGTWSKASEGSLKQRVILRAKRKGAGSGVGTGNGSGAFGGLSSKIKSNNVGLGTFSFEVNKDKEVEPEKQTITEEKPEVNQKPKPETPLDGTGSEEKGKNNSDEEIVKLNEALLKWITGHIKDDPICDLRPIFEDYKNHMTALDQKYGNIWVDKPPSSTETIQSPKNESSPVKNDESSLPAKSSPTDESSKTPPSLPVSSFKFGSKENKESGISTGSSSTGSSLFSFGKKEETGNESKPSFSFGSKSTSGSTSGSDSKPIFSFSGSKDKNETGSKTEEEKPKTSFFSNLTAPKTGDKGGFTFGSGSGGFSFGAGATSGSAAPKSDTGTSGGGGDDEYKPPVVEDTEFEDAKDALYQKKAKIFYMKDGAYKEIGVGQLFVKPQGEDKASILVRADNTLGNILLNVSIPKTPAPTKTGKNNCLLPVVMNPPIEGLEGGVPLLIRVKTSDDCDELIEIIKNKQN